MPFKSIADMPAQCPPPDVIAEDKDPVYRFIDGEEATERDFLNHKEAKKPYPDDKLCEALALSFLATEEAANRKKKNAKSLRKKTIAKGKITKECGEYNIDHTEHINLWLYNDVDMLKIFKGR